MDDLRREVNKAFDQRQSQLGDLEGARERMIHRALAARTSEPANRVQLAAGLAAILIAALVIATFAYMRANSLSTHEGSARNFRDSAALILYHNPANPDQIDGITWDGRTSGHIGQGGTAGGTSNPAGTLYATATDIRDRTGKVVGPLANASVNAFHVTWADDELHYCQVVPASYKGVGPGPGMLQLVLPGAPPSNIAQIGTFWPTSQNQPPLTVGTCSVEGDRAVVSQASLSSGFMVRDWVVQLSTGRILWTHLIKTSQTTVTVGIKATHDGQFVAESTVLPSSGKATIFGPDGSAIAHYAGTVDAFSWDGSLAVISPSSGAGEGPAGGGGPAVQLIRWRVGTVAWTGPAGLHYRDARAEPGGTRIAIGLVDNYSANITDVRLVNLYVISAHGQVVWHKDKVYLA